jgi:hypothetical protein
VKKVQLLSLATVSLFFATFNSIPVQAKINNATENVVKANLIANDWWSPKNLNPCSNVWTCGQAAYEAGKWLFERGNCQQEGQEPCPYGTPTEGNQNGDNSEYCDDNGRCTSRANSRY